MARKLPVCRRCGTDMEKRSIVDFDEDRSTPRRAGGLRAFFIWRRGRKLIWLCPSCGIELPRKLGFFDRG